MTRLVSLGVCLFLFQHAQASLTRTNAGFIAPETVPRMAAPETSSSCTELNNQSFESSFGVWIDGGSNCARVTSFPNSGSYGVQLRNGIGITSSMYTQPMNFTGMGIILSFSFYATGYETGEGLVLEYATDGGTIYTGHGSWVRGYNMENNVRYNVSVVLNGMNWTTQSSLRLRSVASANDDAVYVDDVVISNCCEIGAPCNDNSACTINDVVNSNCQCAGTYQDSDSDGTCDAFDQCPGLDDYLVESQAPCDDGDPCTVNDVMQITTCSCSGQYIDWDQDGYCLSEDPNDLDGCIPDPNSPGCNPCITHELEHFESSIGNWNSGGNDAARVYTGVNSGNYSVRLRDNSGAQSSVYSDIIDLGGRQFVSVSFEYFTSGMETNEDFFLEVSTNGGSSYTIVKEWNRGVEFQNNSRYIEIVQISGITWSSQTRFRFRCDASENDDIVYVDQIMIRSCENHYGLLQETGGPVIETPHVPDVQDRDEIIVSPNPVINELNIRGADLDAASVLVYDLSGRLVDAGRLNENTLDVSGLLPGLYLVRIDQAGEPVIRKFVKE